MSPGTKTLQDVYEILEEIGRGGMATVYTARQLSLGRMVAIKEIKPAFTQNPELVERFKREARTAAGLVHENIAQVYNFGEPSGSLFIVMEFVDGMDLRTLLGRAGMAPPRLAAIIAREVARALAYAHARGLVHRDVKPGNIMVSARGEIKLMDFGIVREIGSELTRTGVMLGTPSYMAPEQFLGEETSPAADLFSLGIVLFEMMAGQKPFRSDSEASLAKKIMHAPEPKLRSFNPEVPRRLQSIVHHCLKKSPSKRPGSAYELARDLNRFIRSASREDDRREVLAWLDEVLGEEKTLDAEEPGPERILIHDRADARPKTAATAQPGAPPAQPIMARLINRPGEDADQAVIKPRPALAPEGPLPEKSPKRKPEPEPRTGKPSRAAADDRSQAPPPAAEKSSTLAIEEPEAAAAGDAFFKWMWRLILVAITLLAALAAFLLVNPGSASDAGAESGWAKRIWEQIVP